MDAGQVAATAVATCQAPDRPDRREWSLAREGPPEQARWVLSLPSPPPSPVRGSEWAIGLGFGWSMDLLRSEGGRHYVLQTFSWAKDLTGDVGPGLVRGRLLWGFEMTPVYAQTAPTSTYGVGLTPLVWRWRFVPRARAAAFAELGFGGLFTRDAVPEGTKTANFSAHGAFGIRWRPQARVGLITAYRFQHLSNGNQLTTNPGVNAHVAWIGLGIR